MSEELEKLKHKQYVAERKLTAAKHKEKHYTFTCQNIILENEFLINEFWNFPMRT